jgi:hypothetical protein
MRETEKILILLVFDSFIELINIEILQISILIVMQKITYF